MQQRLTISPTILNQVYSFGLLYAPLAVVSRSATPSKRLSSFAKLQGGFAAVSIDKSTSQNINFLDKSFKIESLLSGSELAGFNAYGRAWDSIPKLFSVTAEINYLDVIKRLHALLMNSTEPIDELRKRVRLLPKNVWENGVYKTIKLEIKTRPEEIQAKLNDLIDWLRKSSNTLNPLIAAGIAHYKIAEIQPFPDGNGRLARLFERGLLYRAGLTSQHQLALEHFYLRNRERYYDLIEDTVNSGDLTEWLEFYTEGLLVSITEAVKTLTRLSGGAIDIVNSRYEKLTPREEQIIDLISELEQASGAEIAKKLRVTRQNVNVILTRLHKKKLLEKIGMSTSSRYKLRV